MSTGKGTGSSTSNQVIDLRSRRGAPSAAAELHDEWGRLSRERVGISRQHWHHPVTADLLHGALSGDDVRPALVRLGEARATAGVSLADTLADLATFCDVLASAGRSSPRTRTAWRSRPPWAPPGPRRTTATRTRRPASTSSRGW